MDEGPLFRTSLWVMIGTNWKQEIAGIIWVYELKWEEKNYETTQATATVILTILVRKEPSETVTNVKKQ